LVSQKEIKASWKQGTSSLRCPLLLDVCLVFEISFDLEIFLCTHCTMLCPNRQD
jgi:hypothetical protein